MNSKVIPFEYDCCCLHYATTSHLHHPWNENAKPLLLLLLYTYIRNEKDLGDESDGFTQ